MKKDLTEMVWILDRSGSMSGLESDTVGGFNAMVEKQRRQTGEALVTTVLFNQESVTLHDRLPIGQVEKLTERDYSVGGCTALLDAIGTTVRRIADIHRYARPEDVPEHTVFVITTDGMENASRSFTKEQVKALIQQQQERGWEFLFLGANIDAIATAGQFGIGEDRAVQYHSDSAGTQLNYEVVGEAIADLRRSQPLRASWKQRIEEDYASRS
ncbi:MAG: hypothetical protein IJ713_00905 [Oscillibacter sp.]|nr:hypothetical protein [Oscillibacter sp.]